MLAWGQATDLQMFVLARVSKHNNNNSINSKRSQVPRTAPAFSTPLNGPLRFESSPSLRGWSNRGSRLQRTFLGGWAGGVPGQRGRLRGSLGREGDGQDHPGLFHGYE